MRLHARVRTSIAFVLTNLLTFITVILMNPVQAKTHHIDEEAPVTAPQTTAIAIANPPDYEPIDPTIANAPPTEAAEMRINPVSPPLPKLLPVQYLIKSAQLRNAYIDAFEILTNENDCSRFFGGQSAAFILSELTQRITTGSLNHSVALRMKGKVTMVTNGAFKISYRLFDKAEINLNGSFFRSQIFPGDPHVPYVGRFRPNTPEARIAILLHELGHVIKAEGNNWVLPDDGRDTNLSAENTAKVLDVCGKEIREITSKKRE